MEESVFPRNVVLYHKKTLLPQKFLLWLVQEKIHLVLKFGLWTRINLVQDVSLHDPENTPFVKLFTNSPSKSNTLCHKRPFMI